jgi:cell wall-associated NlpC family hydrolase
VHTHPRGRSHWIHVLLLLALLALICVLLPQPGAAQGNVAIVSFTDGDGLNLRDAPSLDGAVLLTMPEGASVEVLTIDLIDDTGRAWAQVSYDGTQGYSAADYLAAVAPPTEEPPSVPPAIPVDQPPSEAPAVTAEAVVGGTDGDGLNVREGAGVDSAILTGLPEGASVTIVGGPVSDANGDPWYQVDADGVVGWAFGAFLVGATAPAAPPSIAPGEVGAALVTESLNYLGTPYVWAGVTPEGFDCSGFTYFIVNQVLADDFPRAIDEQLLSGEFVAREDLQPGDLVFLENTYQPGLSHVGFYIGDGQFVSAVNETDGVAIRDLTDSYWSVRYLTARRVGG